MKPRARYRILLLLTGVLAGAFLLVAFVRHGLGVHAVEVSCAVSADREEELVLQYNTGEGWRPHRTVSVIVPAGPELSLVRFPVFHVDSLSGIRLGLRSADAHVLIDDVVILAGGTRIEVPLDTVRIDTWNLKLTDVAAGGAMAIDATGPSAYLQPTLLLEGIRLGLIDAAGWRWIIGFGLLWALLVLWAVWKAAVPDWMGEVRMSHGVFALLFMLFLGVHGLCAPTGLVAVDPYLERRMLAPWPSDTAADVAHGLEDWFDDRFAVRQVLTRSGSLIDYHLFDKSSIPDKTVLGRNKEMYPSSLFLLDDHMGRMTLSEAQLQSIRTNLAERITYLKGMGKDYYLFFAPSKQTIYPEDLPQRYRKHHDAERTMLAQLLAYLAQDSLIAPHLCDPRPALWEAARTGADRIYFANDIHWNALGAYVGYGELMRTMAGRHAGMDPLDRAAFSVQRSQDEEGDLARSLMLQQDVPRELFTFHREQGPEPVKVMLPAATAFMLCHTTLADTTLPTAVIFRDSFCEDLIPFLSLHFSDALFVWDHTFDVDLIAERRPDLVIHEITEMFIYELLTLNPESIRIHV
ncbi:MAG TPA: hypothetical protein VGE21_01300 [Flavobacteriales bacterium]